MKSAESSVGAALALAGQVALGGHYVTLDMLDVTQATTARGKVSLNALCTGGFSGTYRAEVLGHATTLLRVFPEGDAHLAPHLADIRDNAWMLMRAKDMGGAASDCNCH